MDDVQLERRLTLIESGQATLALTLARQHESLMISIGELKQTVLVQNGRVGKLETWRTQQMAVYGVILAVAPFVFFALGKLFGGG